MCARAYEYVCVCECACVHVCVNALHLMIVTLHHKHIFLKSATKYLQRATKYRAIISSSHITSTHTLHFFAPQRHSANPHPLRLLELRCDLCNNCKLAALRLLRAVIYSLTYKSAPNNIETTIDFLVPKIHFL